MTICSAVTETSGCKHVLNVSLHPNGFCVWCVQYLSILFSFKLEVLKQVFPSMWQSCLCVFVASVSIPLEKKIEIRIWHVKPFDGFQTRGLIKPLSCWMIDPASVTENRISILTAWGYKALSSFPSLWEHPTPGTLPQWSFKDNDIFEVTLPYKWFWLTPTREWSLELSQG